MSRGVCGPRVHERSDMERVDRSKQYVKGSNIWLPSGRRQQSNGAGAYSKSMESQSPREEYFQQEILLGSRHCGMMWGPTGSRQGSGHLIELHLIYW